MMEKRILLAAFLSALVMMMYSQMLPKQRPPIVPTGQQTDQPSITSEIPPVKELPVSQLSEDEEVAFIGSPDLEIELGTETASIRRVIFKNYNNMETDEPLEFGGELPVLAVLLNGERLHAQVTDISARQARWTAADDDGNNYNISISFTEHDSVLLVDVTGYDLSESAGDSAIVEIVSGWNRGDSDKGRYSPLQAILYTKKQQPWQFKYLTKQPERNTQKSVPRGTYYTTLTDRYFCSSLKADPDTSRVTMMPAQEDFIATKTAFAVPIDSNGNMSFSTELYLGTRDHLSLKLAGFVGAFSVGFIGKIGIALLAVLSFIAKLTHNYGVAIIIFSLLVSGALAPFTLISTRSMKRLQELKPLQDKITAKHKGDSQKANVEMMALFKEHKVSPMSGCLPMMLQFPILIALFQSIPNFIDLRGQSFLWIHDLSQADRLMKLPFTLPVLGEYLNILPLLMSGAMLVQMKTSRAQMPANQSNQMMKMMSGPFMPIMFAFFCYNLPSSLIMYWLMNTLTSVAVNRVASKK